MILEELVPWKSKVQSLTKEIIGRSFVFLDGNRLSCRMHECNLGNLITDAIVHEVAILKTSNEKRVFIQKCDNFHTNL